MRSADRDSQDKNLVGSLDRFAKTTGSRDSADTILTPVYPYNLVTYWIKANNLNWLTGIVLSQQ